MTRLRVFAGMAIKASAALLLVLAVSMAGAPAQAGENGPLDPRAVERLQRMSGVLAKARTLSLKAESLAENDRRRWR